MHFGEKGLERRLLATVRWTAATAVARPQASESVRETILYRRWHVAHPRLDRDDTLICAYGANVTSPFEGASQALPVADEARRASGSGRKIEEQRKPDAFFGHRNRANHDYRRLPHQSADWFAMTLIYKKLPLSWELFM